jgi:hypothetical protein
MNSQGAALLAAFQSVSTRVDQASSYTQILCDMHSQFYVNLPQTTANINYEFGQATLPVRSTTDILVQQDVYGNKYISPEVSVSYAVGNNPGLDEFTQDPEALSMLRGEQAWLLSSVPASTVVWCQIKAPMQYRNLTPNVLELWGLPEFAYDLLEVSYQLAGDSFTGTWTALDLSYLPRYDVSSGRVPQLPAVRLHLPNQGLSQIRIKMRTLMDTVWGFKRIKLYHREYEDSGILTVKDAYSRTVSTPILRGKDPSTLSLLTITTNGQNAAINLTTTDTNTTPVLTGVILGVS